MDFIVNKFIFVEYDELHHKYQYEKDRKREQHINKIVGEPVHWVRVKENYEVEGFAAIAKLLNAATTQI